MLRIGLTGGIACGKSTVADMFAALGAAVVDTDQIGREVVGRGSDALEAIRGAFGDSVIKPDGELDRRKLRGIVFKDPAARLELEALLHPRIRARTLEALDRLAAAYVIVVVPLLLETDFSRLVDRVLVVDCPPSLQVRRLVARDGISETDAEAMLAAQIDRESRLKAAADVIANDGGIEATQDQVAALHEKYSKLAALRS